MSSTTAYALGVLTPPAMIVAWAIGAYTVDVARAAFTLLRVHPWRPAWAAYARVSGWNVSILGKLGGNARQWEGGVHAPRREARRALPFGRWPRVLWPSYLCDVLTTALRAERVTAGRATP